MENILNKKQFWLHISALGLSIRLILFEKYSFVLLLVWWLLAFALAFVARAIYPGMGLVVVGLAFVVQRPLYRHMARFRSALIKRGDMVEFVEDTQESYVQQFKRGKILEKMRGEDVAATGLFSEEMIPLYHHFYLVETPEKNMIVPYEWILSLDFEEAL